jgi:hypothetical protein
VSQTATPPIPSTPAGARRRGVIRAVVTRVVLMLLCYNTAIVGYLWYLAREQEEDVVALYRTAGVAPEASDSGATDLRRYQELRRPLVDRLLPDGHHGTLILKDLGGPAGVAWTQTSTIGLLAGSLAREIDGGGALAGEMVEIHERAHLIKAYHSVAVGQLMLALPKPDPAEYAATNRGEHFAEMAAEAYRLVLLKDGEWQCVDHDSQLRHMEEKIPGISGFVLWFIRFLDATAQPNREVLIATATELVGDTAPLWTPIYAALAAQQQGDGVMKPWPAVSPRHRLAQAIATLDEEGRRSTRWMALALAPGEWFLGLVTE